MGAVIFGTFIPVLLPLVSFAAYISCVCLHQQLFNPKIETVKRKPYDDPWLPTGGLFVALFVNQLLIIWFYMANEMKWGLVVAVGSPLASLLTLLCMRLPCCGAQEVKTWDPLDRVSLRMLKVSHERDSQE